MADQVKESVEHVVAEALREVLREDRFTTSKAAQAGHSVTFVALREADGVEPEVSVRITVAPVNVEFGPLEMF